VSQRLGWTQSRSQRSSRPGRPLDSGRSLGFAIAGGLAIALASGLLFGKFELFGFGLIGLLFLVAVGVVAYRHFYGFIALVLFARPAADVLKLGVVVGVGFIGVAMVWLVVRWRSGRMNALSRPAKALLLFSLGAFASAFASTDPAYGISAALKSLSVGILFVVVEELVKDRPTRRREILALTFSSAVVPILLGFQQLLFAGSNFSVNGLSRVKGSFSHPNALAIFCIVQMLYAFALWNLFNKSMRKIVFSIGALSCILMIFTYARAAWGGAVIAGLFLAYRLSRRWFWRALFAIAFVIIAVPSVQSRLSDLNDTKSTDASFTGNENSFAWRVQYWQHLAPMVTKAPLTGLGLESTRHTEKVGLQPHNSYLQTALELGAMGCITLIWSARALRQRARWALRSDDPFVQRLATAATAIGVALAITALTENVLTATVVLWYAVIGFALLPSAALADPSAGPHGDPGPQPLHPSHSLDTISPMVVNS
jgi:O-antigen ligase